MYDDRLGRSATREMRATASVVAAIGLLLVGCGSGSKPRDGGGGPTTDSTVAPGEGVSRPDSETTAGPVNIKNLSAKLLEKSKGEIGCNGKGSVLGDTGSYRLSFVLENLVAKDMNGIARLESLSIEAGSWKIAGGATCTASPWRGMASTSDIIDIAFGNPSHPTPSFAYLLATVPCNSTTGSVLVESETCDSSGTIGQAPYSGTVTLELRGLLDDATPWTAQATAELQDVSQ